MATGSAKRSAKRISAAQAASDQRLPPTSTTGRFAAHNSFCSRLMSVRPGQISTGSKARGVRHRDALGQHVLRQRDHHRAGAAVAGGMEGARDELRECARGRRFRSPIWRSSRTPRGSRAPGTPRARACRARPGRRTRSSARNSWRAMWMPATALVAPGPRVTKQMPGRPVALPTASAIIAAALSCRQTVSAMSLSWKASSAAR